MNENFYTPIDSTEATDDNEETKETPKNNKKMRSIKKS